MKVTIRSLVLAGSCCLSLFGLSGQAQAASGLFLGADLGVALAEDVELRRFLVPTPGTDLKLDPGMRFSIGGGYNFNDYVGIGLETGFIFNNIDRAEGPGGDSEFDGTLSHIPLMANAVVRYDKPDCKWVPYAGAGIGGDVSIITLDNVDAGGGTGGGYGKRRIRGTPGGGGGGVVDGADSTIVFAWQVFAGVRYKFTEKISLGAGYKYYSANSAKWDVDGSSGDIRIGRAAVHSIGLDFNLKF